MRTVKSILGKTFPCVAVAQNLRTVEDVSAMREQLQAMAKAQNVAFSETDTQFCLGACQFVLKPKLLKERKGRIEIKSSGYVFHFIGADGSEQSSYGDKINAGMLTETGFRYPVSQGFIEYTF